MFLSGWEGARRAACRKQPLIRTTCDAQSTTAAAAAAFTSGPTTDNKAPTIHTSAGTVPVSARRVVYTVHTYAVCTLYNGITVGPPGQGGYHYRIIAATSLAVGR